MRSKSEIMERLAECTGEIRRLDNKEELSVHYPYLSLSVEEYEVRDALVGVRDALMWVIEIGAADDIEVAELGFV